MQVLKTMKTMKKYLLKVMMNAMIISQQQQPFRKKYYLFLHTIYLSFDFFQPVSSTFSAADIQIEFEECIKCPNKWNPYHTCVEYCKKR
jgi:hypothetical protein